MNPWDPMTGKNDVRTLGKFGEELGECTAAVSRCLIQGIDEVEPTTGKPNRLWLMEEIADVMAGVKRTIDQFDLDIDFIGERGDMKVARLEQWMEMP